MSLAIDFLRDLFMFPPLVKKRIGDDHKKLRYQSRGKKRYTSWI